MERTTFVIQRCTSQARQGELIWKDAVEYDNEQDARHQLDVYIANLGPVLGPFRIVRRTETVI